MNPLELAGKKITVVGAGKSGIAAARFCAQKGARVTLTDARDCDLADPRNAALASLSPSVKLELGGHVLASFEGADLLVLSPGVPPTLLEIAAAQRSGVAVTGEMELASRFVTAPIVAITGTNGKSTVTSLCGAIARATGRPTFVGGNFGTPLTEAVGTDAGSERGIVVCECSSYQLETIDTFHPRAAVLLNVTSDHLDRYSSMAAYADAKMRITRRLAAGDVFVLNEDCPVSMEAYARNIGGWLPTLTYSTVGRPHHRFASPSGDGVITLEVGGFVDGETLVLRLPDAHGHVTEERYDTAGLELVGRHNLGNALAALLAMRASGLATHEEARAGASAFRPLPHRMELVAEMRGVRYYDDSKGTNVGAVVASLDGFARPFILIAGGRDKGGSYGPLREMLQRNIARGVIVIGEAADKIASSVEGVAPVHRAATLEAAVTQAASWAHDGDAVVLSPACSSFDMFKDYEHRGQVFRDAVGRLA